MATTKYSYIEINTLLYQVLKPPKVENMKITFSLIPNPPFSLSKDNCCYLSLACHSRDILCIYNQMDRFQQ